MTDAAAGEQFERAAHLRDAIRTIETVRDRRNTVETPAMGDRDAFGVRAGSAGAVVVVFQVRRGRVVDRCELIDGGGGRRRHPTTADLLADAAVQQFYAEREPPSRSTSRDLPVDDREAIEAWLTERASVASASTCRGGATNGACWSWPRATPRSAYQSHFGEGDGAALRGARQLRDVLALPALPRRIECFDISTLQGSETVGVDGRRRRRPDEKRRIPEVQDQGRALPGSMTDRCRFPMTLPPSTKSCCGGTGACSSTAGRFPT